ncbi:hypothetical protein FI667_g4606, partial [Globisporangium splendens]
MKPQVGSVPLKPILKKIVPLCFVTGMAMEAFMVNTGFYDIVTVNEAERRQQRAEERREYLQMQSEQESSEQR